MPRPGLTEGLVTQGRHPGYTADARGETPQREPVPSQGRRHDPGATPSPSQSLECRVRRRVPFDYDVQNTVVAVVFEREQLSGAIQVDYEVTGGIRHHALRHVSLDPGHATRRRERLDGAEIPLCTSLCRRGNCVSLSKADQVHDLHGPSKVRHRRQVDVLEQRSFPGRADDAALVVKTGSGQRQHRLARQVPMACFVSPPQRIRNRM